MHYPDLGTSCPIASGPRVRAIGWLAAGHDFPTGQPDPMFANALAAHLIDGWRHVTMPALDCAFCKPVPGVEGESEYILVPADDLLFIAPSMILHYIIGHSYAPPPAFCAAVSACLASASPKSEPSEPQGPRKSDARQ